MRISELLAPFVASVAQGRVEFYNEFSLQHELGIFLRSQLPDYRVQFERNVEYFFGSKSGFTKREIDITVFSPDKRELPYAIELKFPRNGQHPEQMFSFCKDIAFAEELKEGRGGRGFSQAGVVILAEDPLFYQGKCEGIYRYFRCAHPLTGKIPKPTGKQGGTIALRGTYTVTWGGVLDNLKWTVIEASP